MLSHFSCVWLFATLRTVAHQASLSMGFSRQEYWSGLACSPPGDLPNPRIKPTSPALQVDLLLLGHQKSPHYDIVPSRRYSRNCHSLSSISSLPCSPLAYQNCSLFLCVLRAFIHAVTLWCCGRDSSSYFHLFPCPPAPNVGSDMEQTQTTYYSSELMNHLESLLKATRVSFI